MFEPPNPSAIESIDPPAIESIDTPDPGPDDELNWILISRLKLLDADRHQTHSYLS